MLKIILLNCQNNVGRPNITSDTAKSFHILAISSSVPHNYFELKLFSNLYPVKFF